VEHSPARHPSGKTERRRKIRHVAAHDQPGDSGNRIQLASAEEDAEALADLVRQVSLARPLQADEERTLLERIAQGDRGSEDRLVAGHLAMVIRLAGERTEQGLSVADLVQEGSIGLVGAVRSFIGSGERDFARFAEEKVGAQMEAAIATDAAAVRETKLLVAAASDYEHTDIVMRHELKRAPTEAELAEKLEWTVDRTRYVAGVVAEARRRYDEEVLAFIDPADIDFDNDDERAEFDG
jgi:DNA-directed RNA polymerase sigma subunit (sigma70/sigma32)